MGVAPVVVPLCSEGRMTWWLQTAGKNTAAALVSVSQYNF
jgi:hypothetical protein